MKLMKPKKIKFFLLCEYITPTSFLCIYILLSLSHTQDIMNEIQAIIRQITASVTFLPLLQVCPTPHTHTHSHTNTQTHHTQTVVGDLTVAGGHCMWDCVCVGRCGSACAWGNVAVRVRGAM